MTELERRVAHLERELLRRRRHTIATVVATALVLALACHGVHPESPDHLRVGELPVDRAVVVGDRDKAHVTIDANGIEIGNPQQRTLIRPMETTIGDGHVSLDLLAIHDDAVIELKTDDHDLRLSAATTAPLPTLPAPATPATPQHTKVPPPIPTQSPMPTAPSPPKTARPDKCDPFNALHGCSPAPEPTKPTQPKAEPGRPIPF